MFMMTKRQLLWKVVASITQSTELVKDVEVSKKMACWSSLQMMEVTQEVKRVLKVDHKTICHSCCQPKILLVLHWITIQTTSHSQSQS